MESLDEVRKRFEALEQQTEQLKQQTHVLARQVRWWRVLACSGMLLGLVNLPLQSGTAADTQPRGMAERMATLEHKLSALTFDGATNEVAITGANLRIVNGLGTTETTNGLGNLIVGYNEPRSNITCDPGVVNCKNTSTGSHNVVVGKEHNFSSFGGLVVGYQNEISGIFATITAGSSNTASGDYSSISGGFQNKASGNGSSISGGGAGTASGFNSSIGGGDNNIASGHQAWIGGGDLNNASNAISSVCGGLANTASGRYATVSGGQENIASGESASVSGGHNRSAPALFNWAAGSLFADH
jgi:trimeric autotransporter adhesin